MLLNTADGRQSAHPAVLAKKLPAITSVIPYPWQSGSVVPYTIYGAGFGTNPMVSIVLDNQATVGQPVVTKCVPIACRDNFISGTVALLPEVVPDWATVTVGYAGYLSFVPQAPPAGGQGAARVPIYGAGEPSLSVTVEGMAISPNSTVFITPAPAFPSLVASLVPAQGQPLSGNVSWQFVATYTSPEYTNTKTGVVSSTAYTCSAPGSGPGTLPAGTPWNIANEGETTICGGNATISCTYGSYSRTFALKVLGQNPAPSAAQTLLESYTWTSPPVPWFLFKLVNHESVFRQFNASGSRINLPNYGPPQGFGIMQLDPPDNLSQIWDWTRNVNEGARRLDQIYRPPAVNAWARQLQLWTALIWRIPTHHTTRRCEFKALVPFSIPLPVRRMSSRMRFGWDFTIQDPARLPISASIRI
jgi:hypothetical protein